MNQISNARRNTIRRRMTRNGISIRQDGQDVKVCCRHNSGATNLTVANASSEDVAVKIVATLDTVIGGTSKERAAAVAAALK